MSYSQILQFANANVVYKIQWDQPSGAVDEALPRFREEIQQCVRQFTKEIFKIFNVRQLQASVEFSASCITGSPKLISECKTPEIAVLPDSEHVQHSMQQYALKFPMLAGAVLFLNASAPVQRLPQVIPCEHTETEMLDVEGISIIYDISWQLFSPHIDAFTEALSTQAKEQLEAVATAFSPIIDDPAITLICAFQIVMLCGGRDKELTYGILPKDQSFSVINIPGDASTLTEVAKNFPMLHTVSRFTE